MSLISWLANPPADAAIEIAPDRVAVAAVATRGAGLDITAYAMESLPPGAIVPSLTERNLVDRPVVTAAVRAALDRLGTRPRRVALVVPDVTAKVSLVRFDTVPVRRSDLEQLIRWQVRKSAPFPIEEASLTFTAGAIGADGSAEFVVAMARRDIVREYEGVCEDARVYAGLVDITSFGVLNLLLASPSVPSGDWLVVHMRPEYTSIAILRGAHVLFFRSRPESDEEPLADLVHQTVMYHQDRLSGQGFSRVLVGGARREAGAVSDVQRSLAARLGTPVDAIDVTSVAALADRIKVTPDLVDVLAPLVGMLARTGAEAVTT